MSIEVTVRDTETGDIEVQVIVDDYAIVSAGECYVSNIQTYANGTHVLTVKGRRTI